VTTIPSDWTPCTHQRHLDEICVRHDGLHADDVRVEPVVQTITRRHPGSASAWGCGNDCPRRRSAVVSAGSVTLACGHETNPHPDVPSWAALVTLWSQNITPPALTAAALNLPKFH
jgi:hypothetical protein